MSEPAKFLIAFLAFAGAPAQAGFVKDYPFRFTLAPVAQPSCVIYQASQRPFGYLQERFPSPVSPPAPATPPAASAEEIARLEIVRSFGNTLLDLGKTPDGPLLGILRLDPRPLPDLDHWLSCHPRLALAMGWPDWHAADRERLRRMLSLYWDWYEKRDASPDPSEENSAGTVALIASSLAAEMGGWFPWSLEDLDEESLVLLLDPESLEAARTLYIRAKFIDPSASQVFVPDFAPSRTLAFILGQGLTGTSRLRVIGKALEWLRSRRTPKHDSCEQAAAFLLLSLRAMNIPVRLDEECGHLRVDFPADHVHLTHATDPLDPMARSEPPFPAHWLLIPDFTERAWFQGIGNYALSRQDRCRNVGRKPKVLAIATLPDPLLALRCADRKEHRTPAKSRVFRVFSSWLSIPQLQSFRLWQRLDEKIAERGECSAAR